MAKPICTSCQHCRIQRITGVEFAKCHAPQGVAVSARLVGHTDPETRWVYCSVQRGIHWPMDVLLRACGQRGRWFQPKEMK